jgi:uncharacterized protein YlaI
MKANAEGMATMAQTKMVVCDVCGERVPLAEHSRIKWGREPEKREPLDLCSSCADRVAAVVARPEKERPFLAGLALSEKRTISD